MKKLIMLIAGLCFAMSLWAQQKIDTADFPIIGKPCPDHLLQNIKYYKNKQSAISEFKGKWLVLDFWNKDCGACVASFPKDNLLQQEFQANVVFLLVGIQDAEHQIERKYELYRQREKLHLACSFDSTLAKQWTITSCPVIVIVDDKGVVRGVTSYITREILSEFISGETPKLTPYFFNWQTDTRARFLNRKSLATENNGATAAQLLYQSLLTAYDGSSQQDYIPASIDDDSIHKTFQCIGANLYVLYNYAYFGTIWPDKSKGYHQYPIFETKDTSLFDYATGTSKNLFSYSITVPAGKASAENLQRLMRDDLSRYFGYSAHIEERPLPAWRLIIAPGHQADMLSKGEASAFEIFIPKVEYNLVNRPYPEFIRLLRAFNDQEIIDATGISGYVDFHFHFITDLQQTQKDLKAHGLELVPAQKTYKVLVITDTKQK